MGVYLALSLFLSEETSVVPAARVWQWRIQRGRISQTSSSDRVTLTGADHGSSLGISG